MGSMGWSEALKALAKTFAAWVVLMSGVLSIALDFFLAVSAARGQPVPADKMLAVLAHFSLGAFVLSAAWVCISATKRALQAEQQVRTLQHSSVATSLPSDNRIFLTETVVELADIVRQHTAYQAEKLTADYLSKWIRVVATVNDVMENLGTPRVVATQEKASRHVLLSLDFPSSRRESVIHLRKGARIVVEGKLKSIETHFVALGECRLVGE